MQTTIFFYILLCIVSQLNLLGGTTSTLVLVPIIVHAYIREK